MTAVVAVVAVVAAATEAETEAGRRNGRKSFGGLRDVDQTISSSYQPGLSSSVRHCIKNGAVPASHYYESGKFFHHTQQAALSQLEG
jgi:hypothetical protein